MLVCSTCGATCSSQAQLHVHRHFYCRGASKSVLPGLVTPVLPLVSVPYAAPDLPSNRAAGVDAVSAYLTQSLSQLRGGHANDLMLSQVPVSALRTSPSPSTVVAIPPLMSYSAVPPPSVGTLTVPSRSQYLVQRQYQPQNEMVANYLKQVQRDTDVVNQTQHMFWEHVYLQQQLEATRAHALEMQREVQTARAVAAETISAKERETSREMLQLVEEVKRQLRRQKRETDQLKHRLSHGSTNGNDNDDDDEDFDDEEYSDDDWGLSGFPTSSELEVGSHSISLQRVGGIDVQVPLNDVQLHVKVYKMINVNDEWTLDPVSEHLIAKPNLVRDTSLSFSIDAAKVEIYVSKDSQLHCFVVSFVYRTTILFWSIVWSRKIGDWIAGLRRPPLDVAAALQFPAVGFLADSTLQGNLAESFSDPLAEAEEYLSQESANTSDRPRGGVAGGERVRSSSAGKRRSSVASARGGKSKKSLTSNPAQPPPSPAMPVRKPEPPASGADERGRLRISQNYKRDYGKDNIDKLAFDTPSNESAAVLFGLASPNSQVAVLPPLGSGESGNKCTVYFDRVVGLPLTAYCSRVLVYLSDSVDPTSGGPASLPYDDPTFFMRLPDYVIAQKPEGSNLEPKFSGELQCAIGPNTGAVVIIEYLTSANETVFTFGHCYLSISLGSSAGNFLSRIKMGDPRRSQQRDANDLRQPDRIQLEQARAVMNYKYRDLEASICSEELQKHLPLYPTERHYYCPASYLIWRSDSDDPSAPFVEAPGQPGMSKQELLIHKARLDLPRVRPAEDGVETADDIDGMFGGKAVTMGDQASYFLPFSASRGLFVNVEELRGVGLQRATYIVTAEVRGADGETTRCAAQMDINSDAGAPAFIDPPMLFTGVRYNPFSVILFKVFRCEKDKEAFEAAYAADPAAAMAASASTPPLKFSMVGWTVTKMFLENPDAIRHGRYTLPIFAGLPPPAFLSHLDEERIDRVFVAWLKGTNPNEKLTYLEPHATLTVGHGDPARLLDLVCTHPARQQPRLLLVPPPIKPMIPMGLDQGLEGVTVKEALGEEMLKPTPTDFFSNVLKEFQKFSTTARI